MIEGMSRASSELPNDQMKLSCASGVIAGVRDFGISTQFENQRACDVHQHCEASSLGCNQYCDQFFHNPNFQDYFTNQCVGKKNCAISQVNKFVAKEDENLGKPDICRSSQSRFYLQYECKESQTTIDTKRSSTFKMAIFEAVGAFLVLFGLIFNSVKTQKMGKQYDELNLTASDYTLYIDVSASHRSEFEDVYARQLGEEQPRYSRGFLFK
jgi:hypothetical protein